MMLTPYTLLDLRQQYVTVTILCAALSPAHERTLRCTYQLSTFCCGTKTLSISSAQACTHVYRLQQCQRHRAGPLLCPYKPLLQQPQRPQHRSCHRVCFHKPSQHPANSSRHISWCRSQQDGSRSRSHSKSVHQAHTTIRRCKHCNGLKRLSWCPLVRHRNRQDSHRPWLVPNPSRSALPLLRSHLHQMDQIHLHV